MLRRFIIALVALCLLATQAVAAVAVSATGTVSVVNNNPDPTYTGMTVNSGDTALLVTLAVDRGAVMTFVSVTWGAQTMTLVPGTDTGVGTGRGTALFGLINPTAGNQTLTIDTIGGGGENWYIDAISFTGTDTTNVATAFPNGTFATGNTALTTVTVTSASGDIGVAVHCATNQSFTAVNNTQIFLSNAGGSVNGAANRAAGAASVTLTGTLNSTSTWSSSGTSVKAAGGGAAQTGTKSLMGFGK